MKIKTKLIYSFLCFAIVPTVLIAVFSYIISSNTIKNKLINSIMLSQELMGRNVEFKMKNINKALDMIFIDDKIQQALLQHDLSLNDYNTLKLKSEITSSMNSYFYDEKYIDGLILFSSDKGDYQYKAYIKDPDVLREAEWYGKVMENNGKIAYLGNIDIPLIPNNKTVLCGRVIRNLQNSHNRSNIIGVCAVLLNNNIFQEFYQNVEPPIREKIIILNNEGSFISSNDMNMTEVFPLRDDIMADKQGHFNDTINGQDITVIYYTSQPMGWKIIKMIDSQYFTREINSIKWITIFMMILCFFSIIRVLNKEVIHRMPPLNLLHITGCL